MPSRRHDSLVFTVVVSAIAALAAVPFAILMLLTGEGPSVVIASLFALLPVGPLLACYLWRSEEHTSELQSLMRISYAVFCLKKKKQIPRSQYTYGEQLSVLRNQKI